MAKLPFYWFTKNPPLLKNLRPGNSRPRIGKGLVVFLSGAVMERILQSHRADIATGHQRRKVPEGVEPGSLPLTLETQLASQYQNMFIA